VKHEGAGTLTICLIEYFLTAVHTCIRLRHVPHVFHEHLLLHQLLPSSLKQSIRLELTLQRSDYANITVSPLGIIGGPEESRFAIKIGIIGFQFGLPLTGNDHSIPSCVTFFGNHFQVKQNYKLSDLMPHIPWSQSSSTGSQTQEFLNSTLLDVLGTCSRMTRA
jgi:hypothetical protein